MRRTERLFAIAEYLRGRRTGVTAEQLAERFNVTLRTMYRDLASLRDAELPLKADRGRGGGYALDKSYNLPPINLTAREAAVLISAGKWLAQMRVLPFARTLDAAIDKIRAALSTSSQRDLLTVLDGLKYVGIPAKPTAPAIREAVERAFFEKSRVEIVYLGSDELPSTRTVRIEQIVMDRSETLLNCVDLEKNAPRQFRMHRIQRAKVQP
jgi:predicted DNA-binding transcriptional regulator YafY